MAEAYQVLARKWRPQLFAELAGLEHIARTLQNAIRLDRVGHAFIFTGSRGVGKTSAARVLAKALNCVNGPAQEPCNRCENCLSVTAGSAADVIEIDGASNRGVGEIRLLRENVTYLPQSSPYKIYIIDEVHMLTTEAFNALLKTLEEPPDHVKFIMATTDVHKVPMTILSRCQRFDFGRLTGATIAAALIEIGERENLTFGPGATELLAREAQGSMRDALSLLDQARSYAGEVIAIEDLRSALGLIEARHSFALLGKIVSGDLSAAVSLVNDLEQAGVDLKKFSEEFLFYLRDALFLKLSADLKGLLTISPDEIGRLEPLVGGNTLPYWQQLFDLWQGHYSQIKISQTPRLALEMALIELGMARDLLPVEELLGRIDRHLKDAPVTTSPATVSPKAAFSGNQAAAVSKPATPAPAATRSQTQNRPPAPPPVAKERQEFAVAARSSPSPVASEPRSVPKPLSSSDSLPKTPVASSVKPAVVEERSQTENYGVSEMPPQAPPPDDFSDPAKVQWGAFLERLANKDARLGAMLQRSRLQPSAAGILLLEVAPHALALLDLESVKQEVLSLWAEFQGRNDFSELKFQTPSATSGARKIERSGNTATGAGKRRPLPSKEEIFNNPSVRFISDRFGGRVTEIKPRS
ncbi:MAG: DNA polymerase III subunit gamma/tau [Pseudomonadota bacterium]|nr:DNA polymerase III subunit gamma/tau [Pseudomonadota bacterium]